MIKFKVGDTVRVTAGKDKGREGKIEKINPSRAFAIIPGINLYKKHVKGFGDVKGGVYDIPRGLSYGKIALICPKCKKVTRIGFSVIKNPKTGIVEGKTRICKKCKKEIDTK